MVIKNQFTTQLIKKGLIFLLAGIFLYAFNFYLIGTLSHAGFPLLILGEFINVILLLFFCELNKDSVLTLKPIILGVLLRTTQLFLRDASLLPWNFLDFALLFFCILLIFKVNQTIKSKVYLYSSLGIVISLLSIPQLYFHFFNKVIAFSDYENLSLLFDVLSQGQLIALVTFLGGGFFMTGAVVYFLLTRFFNMRLILLIALPALILFGAGANFSSLESYLRKKNLIVDYSQKQTSLVLGIYPSLIYFELKRRHNISLIQEKFKERKALVVESPLYKQFKDLERVNIHMVLLESWIDLTRLNIEGVNNVPVLPEFEDYLKKGTIFQTKAFGGGTATAEFEYLCGVPSLMKYSSIDFNVMKGHETLCLPSILQRLGYQTVMSNTWGPYFFNSQNAYQSLGFSENYYFCSDCENYYEMENKKTKEKSLFDGILYERNLEYLRERLKEGKGPIFNYLVGSYGHFPFERDHGKRPNVWDKEGVDPIWVNAVNQFHYKQKILLNYVKKLQELDPDSLILLLGDHLPNIRGKEVFVVGDYLGMKSHLLAQGFILYKKKMYQFETMPQYFLSYAISDVLTGACKTDQICEFKGREISEEDYDMVISGSLIKGFVQ